MQEKKHVWEAENWAIYKDRYSFNKLDTTVTSERIEIIDSRIGMPTVRVMSSTGKKVFLHSSVDPVKEAKKIAESVSSKPGNVIVVYGFGLGYLVEALLETVDERSPIFIIEPERDLFCAAMAARDLRHLLSSERLYILVSDLPRTVKAYFFSVYNAAKHQDIIVTGLAGHRTVYGDFYDQSMRQIKEVVSTNVVNLVTGIRLGWNFVSNSILNLLDYSTYPGIVSLFNRMKGMPAIIVSAGPSLNKNIQLLKEVKGKAVIIAVGTAVKALKKWDIEADFIFSIDPHPLNYEHMKGVDVGRAALVAEIQTHHMIFENYQGPVFVSGDMPILNWFGDSIEKKGKIESGGSVANNAFVAAYKMGADPIILVGQDLAYSRDGHSHATGTIYEDKVYCGGENASYFQVKANDGGKLLTDRAFYQFLIFFEQWIDRYSDREYINATEGGAFIPGTKIMTLREVIDEYCQETTIDVQELIREAQISFKIPNMEPILEKLELRLKDAKKTIIDANKAIKHLKQLEKACEDEQTKKMQQHLKAVTKIYKKFENDPYIREVVEAYFQHELHGIFSRTHTAEYSEEDDFHAAIADYRIYYEKVLEGTKALEDLLHRCIEKFRRNMCND
ncbi:6-hydroxymethylpterin diphosphokinase MptE-like protein [Pelosinus sp. IPA-1]|uniref:motility associated factor glycosyltransferase family protein n=1 Tax=Pelosinus sp. IPA-1 TaxID=3029569 RepID=UPI002552445D|nr:6-hydroxymethylpterin diphosphokinase MptE-like protein [Pelosinus sp. IPA-1]